MHIRSGALLTATTGVAGAAAQHDRYRDISSILTTCSSIVVCMPTIRDTSAAASLNTFLRCSVVSARKAVDSLTLSTCVNT
jgi:hypothetical protein